MAIFACAVLAVASTCALLWAGHTRYGELPPPQFPGAALAGTAGRYLAAPASSPPQVEPPPSWQVKPDPPGAATVVTGGRAWTTERFGDYLGLAQAGSEANRPFWGHGTPGLQSLISPDGRRLVQGGSIVDLDTSPQGQFWGEEDSDEFQTPQAWSPDGRYVALLANLDRSTGGGPGDRTLRLLDTRTGDVGRDLAAVHWPRWPTLGWAVAFSPDSRHVAYQDGNRIRIIELDGDPVTEVVIPAGSRLAGKGAWTRDGTGLLIVSGERCACGSYPARWTVRTVSIATGELSDIVYQVDGAYMVRVLGWWRSSGRPVIAEYLPTAGAAVAFFSDPSDEDTLTGMRNVASVRLLRLSRDAQHDVLLQAAAQSLDVADDLINPAPSR